MRSYLKVLQNPAKLEFLKNVEVWRNWDTFYSALVPSIASLLFLAHSNSKPPLIDRRTANHKCTADSEEVVACLNTGCSQLCDKIYRVYSVGYNAVCRFTLRWLYRVMFILFLTVLLYVRDAANIATSQILYRIKVLKCMCSPPPTKCP
jgi:hypothetical protein